MPQTPKQNPSSYSIVRYFNKSPFDRTQKSPFENYTTIQFLNVDIVGPQSHAPAQALQRFINHMNQPTLVANLYKLLTMAGAAGLLIGLGLGSLSGYSFKKRVRFKDHIIGICNNGFGWETILLDDQVLVSRFGLFGGKHNFAIGQNKAEVKISYKWHMLGAKVRFSVDDQVYYEE